MLINLIHPGPSSAYKCLIPPAHPILSSRPLHQHDKASLDLPFVSLFAHRASLSIVAHPLLTAALRRLEAPPFFANIPATTRRPAVARDRDRDRDCPATRHVSQRSGKPALFGYSDIPNHVQVSPLRINKTPTSSPAKGSSGRPLSEIGSGERRRNSPSFDQTTKVCTPTSRALRRRDPPADEASASISPRRRRPSARPRSKTVRVCSGKSRPSRPVTALRTRRIASTRTRSCPCRPSATRLRT